MKGVLKVAMPGLKTTLYKVKMTQLRFRIPNSFKISPGGNSSELGQPVVLYI